MDMVVEELAGGITRVALSGRLDIAGAAAIDLRFNAIAGAKAAISVDLTQVTFLASMGIRTLLTGAKASKNRGGKLVVLSPPTMVEKVLETAGIDALIPIFRDEAEALAAVR